MDLKLQKDLETESNGEEDEAEVNTEDIRGKSLDQQSKVQAPDDGSVCYELDFSPITINRNLKIIESELCMLYAYLSFAANQKTMLQSNVELGPCANYLADIATKVSDELQELHDEVTGTTRSKKTKNKWKYIIPATMTATASIFFFKLYFSR